MRSPKEISKFMSLVLRHQPDKIGLKLDENGWTPVADLLEKMKITQEDLNGIFKLQERPNDKKRFAYNEDKTKIRASQGHSVEVDLELEEVEPPEFLYHGTAEKFLNSILRTGLNKGKRHHVHMSKSTSTAGEVGMRNGSAVILEIDSKDMYNDGFKFYKSANGVYLTESVPVNYINVTNL